MSSCSGENSLIVAQSAEPIEPAAPVTKTRLPSRYPFISSRSRSTSSRDRKSESRISRISVVPGGSVRYLLRRGTTRTSSPAWILISAISATVSWSAEGTDISSTEAANRWATFAMSARPPTTGTPRTRSRDFDESSSTNATGKRFVRRSSRRARTISRPPSPAPNTMTRLARSWSDRW